MKQAGVIQKNELHLTLASKKAQHKVPKKVLKIPNASYRPILTAEDEEEIKKIMETLFPPLKRISIKVQWSEIKSLSTEERKTYRNKMKAPEDAQVKENRKKIISGINAVTRYLEKKLIKAVIVAKDVDPPFMVNHVINLCIANRVPILIMESLKEITRTMLGYTAIVIGFKTNLNKNYFSPLISQISKISSRKFPMPEIKMTMVKDMKYKALSSKKMLGNPQGKLSADDGKPIEICEEMESDNFIPLSSTSTNKMYESVKLGTVKENPNRKKKNKKRAV